jgi:EAL domain-containing protein (putative c-di-GMP-specific phosphodiesterase class I)
MNLHYEIKNKQLKKLVEKQAQELGIPINQLILNYINRELMSDSLTEYTFEKLHSDEFLKIVDDALTRDFHQITKKII